MTDSTIETIEDAKPTKEDIKRFGFVADYVYNVAYRRGFDEGITHARSILNFSRKAMLYSGHFVLGMFAGGLATIIAIAVVLRHLGLDIS